MTVQGSAARTEILRRVGSALAGGLGSAGRSSSVGSEAGEQGMRGGQSHQLGAEHPEPDEAMVELFVERVADYRAEVVQCSRADAAAAVLAALGDAGRIVVGPGLPQDLFAGGSGIDVSVDNGLSTSELDGFDAVVTTARLAIAETGTIVLDHGPGQGRRALTLIPDRHVCIVDVSQVVAGVSQAMQVLDPSHPLTWISGPSATSDIELQRVEGVHGPRDLHVVLIH